MGAMRSVSEIASPATQEQIVRHKERSGDGGATYEYSTNDLDQPQRIEQVWAHPNRMKKCRFSLIQNIKGGRCLRLELAECEFCGVLASMLTCETTVGTAK